jgi:hypothetical protein
MGDMEATLVTELLEALTVKPTLVVEEWLAMRDWGASAEQAMELMELGVGSGLYTLAMRHGLTYDDCVTLGELGPEDAADYYNARVGGASVEEVAEARARFGQSLSTYALYRRGGKSHSEALAQVPGHWVS